MKKALTLSCFAVLLIFISSITSAAEDPPKHYFEIQANTWFHEMTGVQERLGAHDSNGDRLLNDNAPIFLEADDSDIAPSLSFLYMWKGEYGVSLSYLKAKAEGSLFALDTSTRGFIINNIDRFYWWDWYVSWIGGEIEAELLAWDITYHHALRYENADTYWRVLAGLSFEEYEEENVHSYDDLNNDPPEVWYTVQSKSKFSSWGPSIGTELSHRIGNINGLAFLGSVNLIYLQGEAKTRRTEIEDPRDVFNRYIAFDISSDNQESIWKMVTNLGVKYHFYFGLGFQVAYRYARLENLPNTPLSVDDTAYHIVDRTRDVSVHGIAAGLSYQWGR